MNSQEFKKRKLEECYTVIYVLTKPIKQKYEDTIGNGCLYILIGINLIGKRTVIGFYLNMNDSRDWIRVFEDIKGRGCEDILYISFEADNKFKRALKLIYQDTILIPSIYQRIENINKYFSDSYSNPLPTQLKDLFLSKSNEEFNIKYQTILEKHQDNLLITTVIKKNLNNVIDLCNIDIKLRKILFNYYFIRDVYKRLNKIKNLNYNATIDDIINLLIEDVIYLEKYKSSTKEDIRHILNVLNNLYEERILRFL